MALFTQTHTPSDGMMAGGGKWAKKLVVAFPGSGWKEQVTRRLSQGRLSPENLCLRNLDR